MLFGFGFRSFGKNNLYGYASSSFDSEFMILAFLLLIFYFTRTLSLHFTPNLQSAAVCSLSFTLTGLVTVALPSKMLFKIIQTIFRVFIYLVSVEIGIW